VAVVTGATAYRPRPRLGAPGRHGHMWSLPDGTGLHAPPGRLVTDERTGRLCCHLCGDWFAALGIHVRSHGHTAGTYRAAMSLPRTTVLTVAAPARRWDRVMEQRAGAHDAAVQADALGSCSDPQPQRSAGWTVIVPARPARAGSPVV